MRVIKFKTKVRGGIIKIPEKYQKEMQDNKDVVVLLQTEDSEEDFIDYLLKNPLNLKSFTPMKRDEIYDRNI